MPAHRHRTEMDETDQTGTGGARGLGAGDLLRKLDERGLALLARLGQGRSRVRLLAGASLVSAAAVLGAAVWAADQHPDRQPPLAAVARIGVVDGESIPGYLASSRAELDQLVADARTALPGREVYALVSLSGYLAPDGLTPILDGASVSAVYARVPLPGVQTATERISADRIPDGVVAGMRLVADRKDLVAARYRELSAQLAGAAARQRELRSVYDAGARVALTEAAAYRTGCGCVYAAVVRATPAMLERMAGRPEVRVVDPAPQVRRLDRAVFVPPLPEQTDVVRLPEPTGWVGSPGGATPDLPGAPTPGPSGSPGTPSPPPAASVAPTPPATVPTPGPSGHPGTPRVERTRTPGPPTPEGVSGSRSAPATGAAIGAVTGGGSGTLNL